MYIFDICKGINAGFDPFTIIDSFDQESYEYGHIIFGGDDPFVNAMDGSYQLSEAASKLTDGDPVDRILVLSTMRITPQWRGRQIGLKALHATTLMYGHASLVIMEAMAANRRRGAGIQSAQKRQGQLKLQKYWRRLGFQRIAKSDYFGMYQPERHLRSLNKALRTKAE